MTAGAVGVGARRVLQLIDTVQIFVAVLGAFNYTFVGATAHHRLEDWTAALAHSPWCWGEQHATVSLHRPVHLFTWTQVKDGTVQPSSAQLSMFRPSSAGT